MRTPRKHANYYGSAHKVLPVPEDLRKFGFVFAVENHAMLTCTIVLLRSCFITVAYGVMSRATGFALCVGLGT